MIIKNLTMYLRILPYIKIRNKEEYIVQFSYFYLCFITSSSN